MNVVVVTGSRDWNDADAILARLALEPADTTIIQGGAPGADRHAARIARALHFKVVTVNANWGEHGKAAGFIRNKEMLAMKPNKVIAFCNNDSRGTMHCVNEAVKLGIPVEVFRGAVGQCVAPESGPR